jgi:hypothetical protein
VDFRRRLKWPVEFPGPYLPTNQESHQSHSTAAPDGRLETVRRFSLAIIVALLTFSATGLSAVIIGEPCAGFEQPGRGDATCPPTCVTCGCCAQAAEPVVVSVASSEQIPAATINPVLPRLPDSDPRDILHVPKPRFS